MLKNKLLTFGNDLSGRDEFRQIPYLCIPGSGNFSAVPLCMPAGDVGVSVRPQAAWMSLRAGAVGRTWCLLGYRVGVLMSVSRNSLCAQTQSHVRNFSL